MVKSSKKKTVKKTTSRVAEKSIKKTTSGVTKTSVKKTTQKVPESIVKQISSTPAAEATSSNTILHNTKDNITPHDKFNSVIFIVGLVAAIILLIVISPLGDFNSKSEYQEPKELDIPNVRVYTLESEVTVGEELVLMVDANNFEDLVAFEFSLGFDPSIIRYKETAYGDFLTQTNVAASKICVPPKDKGGEVTSFACVKFPDSPGHITGVSGSGSLTVVTFDIVGRGDIKLQMNNLKILNSESDYLDYQVGLPKLVIK